MTLLIVDDEIYAIQGLIKMIRKESLGIESILTANCYSQAVNLFMKETVDLLLCDIEMPFGTGLDLVEWVNDNYPETVCIFLTCHDEFDFARQAIRLNCLDYVLKPVSAETINGVLKKAAEHLENKKRESLYREYGKAYISKLSGTEQQEQEHEETGDIVARVENYVMLHLEEDLSVPQLAEKVYISVTHLNRLFKTKTGMTVNEFITDARMKAAREMLESTNISVSAISSKTGYSNYSYFIKIFKKTFGVTPREYRQNHSRS